MSSKISIPVTNETTKHNNGFEMVTDVNPQNSSWQSNPFPHPPFSKTRKLNKELYTNGT